MTPNDPKLNLNPQTFESLDLDLLKDEFPDLDYKALSYLQREGIVTHEIVSHQKTENNCGVCGSSNAAKGYGEIGPGIGDEYHEWYKICFDCLDVHKKSERRSFIDTYEIEDPKWFKET